MNVYAYIEIVKTILQLAIVFLLKIGNFDKLIFYAILTLSVSLVTTIIYRGYCIKYFPECHYSFHTDKKIIKPMLGFSGWNLYTDLSFQAQGNGVNLILNLFFGTIVNAAYGIGLQLSRTVYSFVSNFMLAVKPQIIKYYSTGQVREMELLMNASTRYSFLMLFMLALPVVLETDFILKFWLGNPPEGAVTFSRLFLVMLLLNILWINLTYANQAANKMKLASIVIGTLYLSIPVIAYILFKVGFRNMYLPMIVSISIYGFIIVARLLIVKRIIPQYSICKFVLNVILLSVVTSVVGAIIPLFVYWYMVEGWWRLIFVCLASVISMVTVTLFFATGKDTRKKVILKIKDKFFRNI